MIPYLLSLITGPRYRPEITWSSKSWTHNVFRCYEMIFGRKFGIRAEMTVNAVHKSGKLFVTYKAHTFEAVCALLEQKIREGMPKWKLIRLEVPQLAFVGGLQMKSPFLFAIAWDISAKGLTVGGTSLTYAHTCTGSNLIFYVNNAIDSGGSFVTHTYATIGMTSVAGTVNGGAADINMYYLVAPATGANNVVLTKTGAGSIDGSSTSFSGAKQSAPTITNTKAATVGLNFSMTVTTVDNNSWIVEGAVSNVAMNSGTNCTNREFEISALGGGINDTNAAITPAGSTTMTFGTTNAGTTCAGIQAVISPATGAAINTLTSLSLMGIGN